MAKSVNDPSLALKEVANVDLNQVQNLDDVLDDFSKIPQSVLQQINAEYLNLAENTNYAFVFTGVTKLTSNERGVEKEYDAVILSGKEGKKYVTGAAVLVSSLKRVTQIPCLVKIVTKKKQKGANGDYFDMDIFTIPMETAK